MHLQLKNKMRQEILNNQIAHNGRISPNNLNNWKVNDAPVIYAVILLYRKYNVLHLSFTL